MQFSVPQFTDVEDRIFAGLTFKQFGIVFVAAVIVFVIYTVTKNIPITVFAGIMLGIPSIALTFGKLNGRPLYESTFTFIQFLFGPKLYIFHKQALDMDTENSTKTVVENKEPETNKAGANVKLKELNYLLQQQASEENLLLNRIKENKQQPTR